MKDNVKNIINYIGIIENYKKKNNTNLSKLTLKILDSEWCDIISPDVTHDELVLFNEKKRRICRIAFERAYIIYDGVNHKKYKVLKIESVLKLIEKIIL